MPDFATMLYGGAQQAGANAGGQGVPEAAAKGAELAMEHEKLQMAQAQMQQQREQLQDAKVEKLYGFIQGAHNYQNGADRNAYLQNAYGFAASMGVNPAILPAGMLNGMGSDENMGRIAALNAQVEAHLITPAQVLDIMRDKEALAKVLPLPPESVNIGKMSTTDVLKDVLDRQSREKVGADRASGFNERNIVTTHNKALGELIAPSSPIQKKLGAAQSIENSYQAFLASGGLPQEFEQFQTQLRLNQGATGGRTGVSERAAAHATDLGITAQQYIQIATGQPQDTRLSSDKLVKAMKDVGSIEVKQIKQQALASIDTASAGYKNFYQEHPDKGADYYGRIDALKKQLGGDSGGLTGDTVQVGAKSYLRATLEAYVADKSNASQADYAPAKKALGK